LGSGPHAVNEHTRERTGSGVNNPHLHRLSDLLLVTAVVFGDLLGGLKIKRLRFHHPPLYILYILAAPRPAPASCWNIDGAWVAVVWVLFI
jgi:hypothetical protein